jgi:hypothetical protein
MMNAVWRYRKRTFSVQHYIPVLETVFPKTGKTHRIFQGEDCDTDHCLMVAEVREKLAVSNWAKRKSDMDKLNFKKLKEVDVKEQCQVDISNRFSHMEN